MLVALEALKESVLYMKADIEEVSSRVNAEKGGIVANMDKTFINFETQ
jgi:vacuolar-type H+-ATPase subunit D/Vma8